VAGVGRTGEQESDKGRVAGTGSVVEGERPGARRVRQGQGVLGAVTGAVGVEAQRRWRGAGAEENDAVEDGEAAAAGRSGARDARRRRACDAASGRGRVLGRGFDREVLAGVLDVLEARR